MKGRSSWLDLVTVILLAVALVEGGLVAYRLWSPGGAPARQAEAGQAAPQLIGRPLGDLGYLEPVDAVNLRTEMQKPAVLIALLRTTCPYCTEAKPFLEKLYAEGRYGVVGVFTEDGVAVEAYGARYPAFVDPEGRLRELTGQRAVPLFLVVRGGVVKAVRLGWAPEQAEALRALLEKAP